MALAGALYAGTLGHQPIWDDHSFVFGQPFLRDCRNIVKVLAPGAWIKPLPVAASARPAWLFSILVDTCAGGGHRAAYRLSNLFWHAAGAGAVAALAWELSASVPACAAAGLLFAAHPAHVEAVNILTFRCDMMCLVFMILSLLCYRQWLRARGGEAAASAAATLAFAAAALLSKEMAVVLPALALLGHRLAPVDGERRRRAARAGIAVGVALVAAYLAFRMPRSGYVMRSSEDLFSSIRDRSLFSAAPRTAATVFDDPPWAAIYTDARARVFTMSAVLGRELRRLAWPSGLQGDYAPRVARSPWRADVLGGWATWALLLAAAWALRRRPLASYGLLWAATALLPVSGLIALYNPEADRYLYVPSAGFCLAAAAAFDAAWRARRSWARPAAVAALGLLLLLGAAEIARRNPLYESDERFLQSVLASDPDVPRARLGLALIEENAGDLAQARANLRSAMEAAPDYQRARSAYAGFEERHGAGAPSKEERSARGRQR